MPTIALVDDRTEHRESLQRMITAQLPDGWICRDYPPLPSLTEYIHLVQSDDVAVLVLDERLHEEQGESGAADYSGHDVVRFLRERLPEFPIFVITSYSGDDELQAAFGDVEDVIPRDTFFERPEDYVRRIVRAANKFLSLFQAELARVSELSASVAAGTANAEDRSELKAAQVKLGWALGADDFVGRADWIEELREVAEELARLHTDIEGGGGEA